MSPTHRAPRRLSSLTPALLATAAALTGCAGTDVGNPMTTSRVEVAAVVEAPPSPNRLALPAATLDEAWIGVVDMGLGLAPACTGGPKEEIPTAFEILAGAELPEAPVLTHPADASVCGLTFRLGALEGALPEGAPAALRDASIFVTGQRLDGVPLELRAPLHDTVKLVAAHGDTFSLDDPSTILAFAVDRWFRSVDLTDATLSDGVLRVDEAHNPTLLAAFRKSFRASARLLRDPDGTGAPTAASAAAPLAVSEDSER